MIRKLSLTVYGNQEDREGNPIGKVKLTHRQQWTPAAQRYAAWKKYVQAATMKALGGKAIHEVSRTPQQQIQPRWNKPIDTAGFPNMVLRIYWKNNAHADPESVLGSVADAIFCNDKNLDFAVTSKVSEDGKGRVEIEITT